jgi:hypothetical protein
MYSWCLKLQPEPENKSAASSARLADTFKSLLAGQFPLDLPAFTATGLVVRLTDQNQRERFRRKRRSAYVL